MRLNVTLPLGVGQNDHDVRVHLVGFWLVFALLSVACHQVSKSRPHQTTPVDGGVPLIEDASIAPDPDSGDLIIAFEAEDGELTAPMRVHADGKASGGQYVAAATANAGAVQFRFDIAMPGDHIIWARVRAPASDVDSFFVTIDGNKEDIFDVAEGTWQPGWQWRQVNGRVGTGQPLTVNPREFALEPGQHTLTFRAREANTTLDRIIVTADRTYLPEAIGTITPTPSRCRNGTCEAIEDCYRCAKDCGQCEHLPGFFVSPNGGPSGDGSFHSPWNIGTALNHPDAVKPGDTIWLRAGQYGSGGSQLFTSNLSGTEQAPIKLRQYPGERTVINGGVHARGAWTWFWGFEITNTNPNRTTTNSYHRHGGLNLYERGHKAINLVVHNTGHPGIGFWTGVGDGGEIHGCLLWGNGVYDTVTSPGTAADPLIRGSAIYAQNFAGTRYITEVISFRNFTTGMKAYTEQGYANGFHFEGNVIFDNRDRALFATGGHRYAAERLKVIDNYLYRDASDGATSMQIGNYYRSKDDGDAEIRGNYVVHGNKHWTGAIFLWKFRDLVIRDNTFVSQAKTDASGRPVLLVEFSYPQTTESHDVDNNRYFGGGADPFGINSRVQIPNRSSFSIWRDRTGFDQASTLTTNLPARNRVFVRANRYEAGRANIVIYNWERLSMVPVDVSTVLSVGDRYEVSDAENFFGEPVLRGIYDGRPLLLPMNLTTVSPIYNPPRENKHTEPIFAAFVLRTR